MAKDWRERNREMGRNEPPGSYGCCWKDLPAPNPDYQKCDLPIGHNGPCRVAKNIDEILTMIDAEEKGKTADEIMAIVDARREKLERKQENAH